MSLIGEPKTKEMRSLVPVKPDTDTEQLEWLAAESIYRTAADDAMKVTSYSSRKLPPEEVVLMIRMDGQRPDLVEQMLGAPLHEWDWWLFEATAQVDVEFQNYLIAEGQWRNRQVADWLEAENLWKAQSGGDV